MTWVVFAVVSLIALPTLAFKGHGYRGVYMALALMAFVIAFLVFTMLGQAIDPNDSAQATGAAFINQYGPPTIAWLLATGFGSVIGACLYRARRE